MSNIPTELEAGDALHTFLNRITQILEVHQVPLSTLRLVAYAADAMRVLRQFEQHANLSKAFDDMLKSTCGDWRNPGSIDDPADLITVTLMHVSMTLRGLYADLEKILAEAEEPTRA